MAAKNKPKPKHVPQRTCVGCREVLPKRNLIRLVKTENGVTIDLSGKLPGRGAYLHDQKSCWRKGLKGTLAKALRTTIPEQDIAALIAYMEGLPGDIPADGNSQTVGTSDKDHKMA
ncbi:MAG: YlxR family protein [Anaerolineaceae bacterium]|nr:YlxR family protein [Anaerolineaceae bacterium]MDD4043173.1 YlxR family protein [Anaerolineaceae bacterium]MDD4578429.1 YlxR family protein [Anaerolineaceae bacterium]